MTHRPTLRLATPGHWNSKPQLESYLPLVYEADTKNGGQTSAKEHKDRSWLDNFDPMDQQHLLWSWPQDVQYQDYSVLGTSPKAIFHSTPPAQKVQEHTLLADTEVYLHSNSAEKKLDFSSRSSSPALEKRRASSLLPELEDALSQMDEYEEMDLEPEHRPLSMPFLRVNRDCATGDFKHYCTNDVDDEDSDPYFGMPIYSPNGNDTTIRAIGDENGLGEKFFWELV